MYESGSEKQAEVRQRRQEEVNVDVVDEKQSSKLEAPTEEGTNNSFVVLIILVCGIYTSFLSWALLQERISTTNFEGHRFQASHFISALQSLLASGGGFLLLRYLKSHSTTNKPATPVWPEWSVLRVYLFIALCQAVSNPLAYSALKYVDYLTVLLAKSCKLLPVMAVHILLYRTSFPQYKYYVVALVTLGVTLFSAGKGLPTKVTTNQSSIKGVVFLVCALFLDGLYNTTQDALFKKYKRAISGPQMMAVLNLFTFIISTFCLLASNQIFEVMWFAKNAPRVFVDIALYGLCGAIGQIFVFLTLERFGSMVLVTTTVTRKMGSMLLSVALFNHKLTQIQWFGVVLVFAGVGYEALSKLRK